MSAVQRVKRRQVEAQSALPQPASKRLKPGNPTHVPSKSGLDFLVDGNAPSSRKLEAKLTNGISKNKSHRVDESQSFVAQPTIDQVDAKARSKSLQTIDISSEDESDDGSSSGGSGADGEDASDAELANGHALRGEQVPALPHADDAHAVVNGVAPDVDMEEGEPTFGEMLRARHPDPIDVQDAFRNANATELAQGSGSRALAPPSATSLGTVLTQALKTNDVELMESCFRMNDFDSIRATIQRLQSQHVATLLQRIAERIHKRPGRAGNLMVWVQWSLVAHGGYLASQPALMKDLGSLARVMRERANGLQPLLQLKGKLDMLSAQLEIRRKMRAVSRAANADDLDNEESVLYIEGQGQDWSDDESVTATNPPMIGDVKASKKKLSLSQNGEYQDEASSDEDSVDGMANGIIVGDDEASSEDDEDVEDGLLDIEAEEASEEEEEDGSLSDDSEAPSDEDEEGGESEESEEEVAPPKPKTLNRKR